MKPPQQPLQRTLRPLVFCLAVLALPVTQAQDLTLKPCHLPGLRDAVLCGTLKRPLNPQEPGGRHIGIEVAVVPSKAREKHPDPVYFLAGGPGQSAIDLIPALRGALSRLNNRRDLVFVDQRGTGRSAPLECEPEARLSLTLALDPSQLPARMAKCRAALTQLPYGDLRFFSTSIAMTDLDAVRAALGQEQINVVGASYGTRAALEYMRLYPERVRRMVMDGVAPASLSLPHSMAPDANAALQSLLVDCAAEPNCRQRHPRLAAQWSQIFDSLPQSMSLTHPLTGMAERVTLTAPMVAAMVRGPLYSPELASGLPEAIGEAAQGRWMPLVGLASANVSRSGAKMAMGQHFSVICGEDTFLPVGGSDAGRFAGLMDVAYAAVCAHWPKSPVDPAFYVVPPARAPVLMFSGGIDPATPPRHADSVARSLGDMARHIVVPKAGHGILRLGCTSDLVFKFVDHRDDSQALRVDAACLAAIPRPTVFVPAGASAQRLP